MRLYFLFGMVGMTACIGLAALAPSEPKAQSRPPLGVMGDAAATLLKAQGFDCVVLPENAWLDVAVLTNYPVVVCDTLTHAANPFYYDTIRAYVMAGGVVLALLAR